MSLTTATDLLAAARLTPGRFAGRADLDRAATAGDLDALADLCTRLGIALPERDWARHEAWRRAHAPVGALPVALRLADGQPYRVLEPRLLSYAQGRALKRLRAVRAADRAGIPGPGEWGRALRIVREAREAKRAARRKAREARERARLGPLLHAAVREAGIRTAEHGHTLCVAFVRRGEEGAYSESGWAWAREAGMCAAYCRVASKITTSEHTWHVPLGYVPRVLDGAVYLSETVRVRAGRGTSLVVERLVSGARGRLIWRAQ